MAGNLHVEIECKECRIPEDVRLRLQPRLQEIESAVPDPGAAQLWLTVVHHPRSNVYHAQAKLKLPGETIITGDRNPDLEASLERCQQRILRHVEAYLANPQRSELAGASGEDSLQNDIIAPVEPDAGQLGHAVTAADYQTFRKILFSHEEWVRKRVGRWVQRYAEIQEQIGQSFEIADFVEEVFLLAFEQYVARPTHINLREWLDSLIDPAVRNLWHNPDERLAASYARTLVGEGD